MRLQAVLCVGRFRYAVGEAHVDAAELVPHFAGCGAHQHLHLLPQPLGGGALALRVQDVVIRELGPRFWKRESGRVGEGDGRGCGRRRTSEVLEASPTFFLTNRAEVIVYSALNDTQ